MSETAAQPSPSDAPSGMSEIMATLVALLAPAVLLAFWDPVQHHLLTLGALALGWMLLVVTAASGREVRAKLEDESVQVAVGWHMHLLTLMVREDGRLPAWEGIRLVREQWPGVSGG